MDLDDFDNDKPSQPQPPRPSRFAPKSRGKKQPAVAVTVKKEEEVPPEVLVVEKMDVDDVVSTAGDVSGGVELKEKEEEEEMEEEKKEKTFSTFDDAVLEEEDEEEDYVVAEYDVYYTPPNPDSQLYVMQYPLRPAWRPYELEQRCTEVRLKPSSSEMEVDLSLDVESEYYDPDSPLAYKMKTQTLTSPGKSPQASAYAVGLLKGKKFYLNPIHAVVQLRTSMEYLDSGDLKKKNANAPVKEEGKKKNEEVVEPWICLNYHSSASDHAQTYLRKMVTEESNSLQFSMNPYDYLNSLCPREVIEKSNSRSSNKRFLFSLPLEERLKTLLREGPQLFSVIKHYASDIPAGDLLEVVQHHANLVQGVWVGKSRDCCKKGPEIMARDYALFLFTQNPVMKESELDILGSNKSDAKKLIRDIAVERKYCKDWKFKVPTDVSFIKLYPDIVEHQRNIWQKYGNDLREKITARVPGLKRTEARPVSTSMAKEAREVLSRVLGKLFLTHKVCSLQTIRQGLRDTAVSLSVLPKTGAKNSAVMAAVKNVVDAPLEELQAIISEYAIDVHGLYVLKSSSEHPELNPLRTEIIDLFRGKEPGAALKKGEIIEASKNKPATSEFQKVINEYCVSKGGAWVLKSGDGVSSNDWQSIFKAAKLL